MIALFDDDNWRSIQQTVQYIATFQESLHSVRQYAGMLHSTQQTIAALTTMSPALKQFTLQSRAIFQSTDVAQHYIEQLQADLVQTPAEHEVFDDPEVALTVAETRERIITYSPSLLLLEQLRTQQMSLHDLTWQQFEEVVAELLERDGYSVNLGRGTKDGGKDIVAVKEVPECGLVMSVWQAKKLQVGNKVDIHVIRELADTRTQFGASKGVIVTTTSLTSGALKRVEQDRYLLHKVDGNDLISWIQKSKYQT